MNGHSADENDLEPLTQADEENHAHNGIQHKNSRTPLEKSKPRFSFGTVVNSPALSPNSTTLVSSTTKKVPKNYVPSNSLSKITQARIADMKELEARKDRIDHEDDIWWTIRNNVEGQNYKNIKMDNVHSKLMEPTKATKVSSREKFIPKVPSPDKEKVIVPIDADNQVLKATKSTINAKWKDDNSLEKIRASLSPLRQSLNSASSVSASLSGTKSMTPVSDRLLRTTKSMRYAQWKSKEELAAEEAARLVAKTASGLKVKEPSERLVMFNTAMRRASWQKPEKEEAHPGEKGWNGHFVDGEIPFIEDLGAPSAGKPLEDKGLRQLNRNEPMMISGGQSQDADELMTNQPTSLTLSLNGAFES